MGAGGKAEGSVFDCSRSVVRLPQGGPVVTSDRVGGSLGGGRWLQWYPHGPRAASARPVRVVLVEPVAQVLGDLVRPPHGLLLRVRCRGERRARRRWRRRRWSGHLRGSSAFRRGSL